ATNFFLRKPDDPDSSPLATVEIDLATFVSDVDFATGHDLLSDISYTITQAPTRGTFVANTTASLAGEWFIGGSNLQDNQTWSGTVTFNAAGNVTAGSVTSSAGLTHTIVSGSFTASALGEVTGSFTDNRATAVTTTFTMQMDSGQGTMAGEGNANPAESEDGAFVFIKKSAQFALDPDLAGTWFIGGSDLQDDHTWDGELTIDTAGNVTGGTYNSSEGAGGTPITGGSFSFGANGAVTGQFIDDDGDPVTTDLILQMDYRKGIMAGPGKAVASTEEGMFVFVKKVAPNFVTADLEGTWFLGGSDLEEEDTWDAGVTLDNTGAVIAPFLTYNSSAGPPNSPITGGSFTITAAGSVTGQVTDNDGGGPVTTSFTLQMNDEKDMMGGEGNVTFPVEDDENGFFMLVKAATAPETGQFTYTVDDAEKNAEFYDGNAGNQADIIQFTVSDGEDASNLGQIGIDYRSNVPPVVTAVSPGSDATTPQDQAIDEVDAEGAAVTLAFSVSATDIDDPTNPNTGTDPNIASIAWTIDGGAAVQTDADVTSSSYTFSTADTALHDTVTGGNATRIIVITAKITDAQGVAGVTLHYQLVDPGAYVPHDEAEYQIGWVDLQMLDDGTGGDDVYTVVIPGAIQTNRRLVRYRITAVDASPAGLSRTGPYADDAAGNFAYYVYDGVPDWTGSAQPGVEPDVTYSSDVLTSVPVYTLITKRQERLDAQHVPYRDGQPDEELPIAGAHTGSEYKWTGTLIYDGVVYDNIHYRARGGGWRYSMGKNMWKFDFNRSHSFQARDDYGNLYDTTWDKLNFSAIIQQGNYQHRGEQGLFESAGFKMFNLTGVEAPKTNWLHFRIVEGADEDGPDQYSGDFQGLYMTIEQMDGR
ncbi:MAG: hypothetical protein QF541_23120, partial [Lentisphaeria bacterium]|nr:hypothetical protein [Lentisphaeria bacterium]